jgi:hypothetical protein
LSGLTRLTGPSRKPIAKRFNKWLHSEVVVSIFLTGEFKGDSTPLDELVGSFQPLLDLPDPVVKPPTITRADDNIVPILPRLEMPSSEPLPDACEQEDERKFLAELRRIRTDGIQGQFAFGPTPEDVALDALTKAPPGTSKKYLLEGEDGILYPIIEQRNAAGHLVKFIFERHPALTTSTDGFEFKRMPWINAAHVTLRLNHIIPMSIVERVYLNILPDSETKTATRNMLSYFLAFRK